MRAIFVLSAMGFVCIMSMIMIWHSWLQYHPKIANRRSLSKRDQDIFYLAKTAHEIDPDSLSFPRSRNMKDYWRFCREENPEVKILDKKYPISWDLWLRMFEWKESMALEKEKDTMIDDLLERAKMLNSNVSKVQNSSRRQNDLA